MFADVEGQGDRDAAYDARLASAILPLTKCVIFNWRDSLQVDRMLNLLGVMQRAAHNVDLGEFYFGFACCLPNSLVCVTWDEQGRRGHDAPRALDSGDLRVFEWELLFA